MNRNELRLMAALVFAMGLGIGTSTVDAAAPTCSSKCYALEELCKQFGNSREYCADKLNECLLGCKS